MYHRIAALNPDPHGLAVPPAEFREHVLHLRDHCEVLPLADLVEACRNGDEPPSRAVALTFDDGALDNLTAASPLLLETGLPATFFILADRLDEPHEAWWDQLCRIFLGPEPVPAGLDLRLGEVHRQFQTDSSQGRADAYTDIHRWLLWAGLEQREAVLEIVREWCGLNLAPRRSHRLMTAEELRLLAGHPGHAIGAHSVHHLLLSAQPREVQQSEMATSRSRLEAVLQREVSLFSYPYGAHDDVTVACATDAGFRGAVTVTHGCVTQGTPALRLPRLEVRPGSQAAFVQLVESALAASSA